MSGGDLRGVMLGASGAFAPWPWGEGVWEVPRWAFALIFLLIIAPTVWLLLRRMFHKQNT